VLDLLEDERRAPPPFVAERLDASLRRAHERELRGDEESVQGYQNGDAEQEEQLGHRRPSFIWLLRGGSSSLMR
jgi:hypothetical protein